MRFKRRLMSGCDVSRTVPAERWPPVSAIAKKARRSVRLGSLEPLGLAIACVSARGVRAVKHRDEMHKDYSAVKVGHLPLAERTAAR